MRMALASSTRPVLQRRYASDRVPTVLKDVRDVQMLDVVSGSGSAATTISSDVDVVSRSTVRNSPEVNITVDEVEDDDDDDDQSLPKTNLQSRDIPSNRSMTRNSPDVNITVDEVADDDDDVEDSGESPTTPYSLSKTISADSTSSAGSVEYVEDAQDAQPIDATPSVDFVRKLASSQSRQPHRTIVHQKTWYHLETIEEVLSPIADVGEVLPKFAHALSLTTLPKTQEADVLHKHFPLLVIKSIEAGDDVGELPLSFVA
jgi:hypothetical protein